MECQLREGDRAERMVYLLTRHGLAEQWLPCEVVHVRGDAVTVRYTERVGEPFEVVERQQLRWAQRSCKKC